MIRKEAAAGDGSGKAKYSGGLVLEPKKGLYESFILLLDFNSLYLSIIQEYNLCFTTLDWSSYHVKENTNITQDNVQNENGGEELGSTNAENLPPIPDESVGKGILPRVIKSLVDRRRAVKQMIKQENDTDKLEEVRYEH